MGTRGRSSERLLFERLETRALLDANVVTSQLFLQGTAEDGSVISVQLDEGGTLTLNDQFFPDNLPANRSVEFRINGARVFDEDGIFIRERSAVIDSALSNFDFEPGFSIELPLSLGELLAETARIDPDSNARVSKVDSITVESALFGKITLPIRDLLRPFANVSAPNEAVVGELVAVNAEFQSIALSELVDRELTDTGTIVIDFGDGTVIQRTAPVPDLLLFGEQATHTYSQPGSYQISVSGVLPASSMPTGEVLMHRATRTINVRGIATINDTSGDDTIVLENVNGELRANNNGVVQVLGASEAIGRVVAQIGRGDNLLDASGLLPSQSLSVTVNNLTSDTNTIIGGPAADLIVGGRGVEVVNAGPGADLIATNRGEDTVNGEAGDDVIAVLNSFGFGTPFANEENRLNGGEGRDTLRFDDLDGQLQLFALTSRDPDYEGFLNFTFGVGSSAPGFLAFVQDMEEVLINPQSGRLNLNAPNVDYLDQFTVFGGDENDRGNFTNSTFNTTTSWGGGDDTFLGGAGVDVAHGGAGDDDLSGNAGDDLLIDYKGTNTLDGGSGADTYGMENPTAEAAVFLNTITDSAGDRDKLQFEGFTEGLNVDLSEGSTQQVAPGASIDIDLRFGPSIEDVSFQPVGDQPYNITGSTADNTFGVVPLDITFGASGTPPAVTIGDGLGGNDTLTREAKPLTKFNPFDFAPEATFDSNPAYLFDAEWAPGSGDVIDLGSNARVTVGFPDAFRAVSLDLDLQGVDQIVDVNGNTMRFDSPALSFVGSDFDDTLQIDATIDPRNAVGGDGTDAITIDAGGRPVTQTVEGGATTVEVAGYSPIEVTEFETITIANAGPAGALAFDLPPGTDNALLRLDAIVTDNTTTRGQFTLSETSGAFAAETFLHADDVVEIRSVVGVDTLTIDSLGQSVEVAGTDVLIGDLPAIRLVGFAQVTIEDAGVPGDYNRDGVVNAADYTLWRDNSGAAAGVLANDPNAGPIGAPQYATWLANFGATAGTQVFDLNFGSPSSSAQRDPVNGEEAFAELGAGFASIQSTPGSRTPRLAEHVAITPADLDAALLLLTLETTAAGEAPDIIIEIGESSSIRSTREPIARDDFQLPFPIRP